MLKILLKQPVHLWQTQSVGARVQIVLLSAVVYFYAVEQLLALSRRVADRFSVSVFSQAEILLHLFVLLFLLNGIFIFARILPRAPVLNIFRGFPLTPRQITQVTAFYFLKYQLLPILLFVPFLTAVFWLNPPAGLLLLTFSMIYAAAGFLLLFRLFGQTAGRQTFVFISLGLAGSFVVFSLLSFRQTHYFFYGDLTLALVIFFALRFSIADSRAKDLNRLFPLTQKPYTAGGWFLPLLTRLLKPLPASLRPFLVKETLGLWRNRFYRRLKIFTLIFYFLTQIVLYLSGMANREMWMIWLGLAVIWYHYAQYFNDKYVQPEPEWYFRGLPLRFRQLWLPKFTAEVFFVLLLLAGQAALILSLGYPLTVLAQWLGLLTLFALTVLAVVLNFQIYFYDDPRLGGYAYHFTVVFFAVMSVNYRLVGPLVTLAFLGYFTYRTYRFFKI